MIVDDDIMYSCVNVLYPYAHDMVRPRRCRCKDWNMSLQHANY
jgi:hypothetical protein